MYLINVRTFHLQYFFTEDLSDYAILSHTWGDEEVTYQEMIALESRTRLKAGFQKIAFTCKQAIADGLDWSWVDTCCIDKSSSAELSEAINSMFSWYRTSTRCYAYLIDYEGPGPENKGKEEEAKPAGEKVDESEKRPGSDLQQFRNSRWFRRGWTLQELLAPQTINFFSPSWKSFGTKETLYAELESITRIERAFLLHELPLAAASVAKKMSWAADRECTRTEDIEYCLLGILDVHMPLLYGERHNFKRRSGGSTTTTPS